MASPIAAQASSVMRHTMATRSEGVLIAVRSSGGSCRSRWRVTGHAARAAALARRASSLLTAIVYHRPRVLATNPEVPEHQTGANEHNDEGQLCIQPQAAIVRRQPVEHQACWTIPKPDGRQLGEVHSVWKQRAHDFP